MSVARIARVRPRALFLALLLAFPAGPAFAQPYCVSGPDDALSRLIADLGPGLACGPIRPEEIPSAAWTFYVHMAADNDLATFGAADIAEMARAGSSPGRTNVFVLADGPASWGPARLLWMPPAGTGCGPREVIVDGALERHLVEPNLGDPHVLRDALSFVTSRVPAEHVFLDIWNHGSGWRGISYDDTGDHLDFASGELAEAIDGLPVDVVGADACLTATAEVAIAVHSLKRTTVRALVGSQENEPGHGWNYEDFLPRMASAIDARRNAPIFDIVSAAVRSYEGTGAETLSATDIDMAEYVFDEIGKVAMTLLEVGGLNDNPTLRRIYESSLRFGYGSDLMDLGDFARGIAETHDGELRQRALGLASALNGATVYGTGMGGRYANANGLSIYAPRGGVDPSYAAGPWNETWLPDWTRLIESYSAAPRPGFEIPAWARPHGGASGTVVHSSSSWSDRSRLPVSLSWAHAFGFDGEMEIHFGGHSSTGAARVAKAELYHATRTLKIQLEPDPAPSARARAMFADDVRYRAPGDGLWTIVFEHAGVEIGRAEWWPGKGRELE